MSSLTDLSSSSNSPISLSSNNIGVRIHTKVAVQIKFIFIFGFHKNPDNYLYSTDMKKLMEFVFVFAQISEHE